VGEYFNKGIVGQNVDRRLRLTYIALVSYRFGRLRKDVRRCRVFGRDAADAAFRVWRCESGLAINELL
jgi:hypothetical protein